MKKLIALLLCVVCLAQSAYAASPAESARDLALSAASGQKSLAGVSGELLAQGEDFPAGTSVCDWTAIAFALLGAEDGAAYLAAENEYISANFPLPASGRAPLATDWQRAALTVRALGGDPAACGTDGSVDLIAGGIYDYAGDTLGMQGLNGWIFALIALDCGGYAVPEGSRYTREDILSEILLAQEPDGGFGLVPGASDTDITAMAVQALAPYAGGEASSAVDAALAWLAGQMTDECLFAYWGQPSAESSAQVIIALCSLGIDPAEDARFAKSGTNVLEALCDTYRRADGSYAHTPGDGKGDFMATEQVMLAFTALWKLRSGAGRLYDMTAVPQNAPEAAPAGTPYSAVVIGIAAAAAAIAVVIVVVCRKKKEKRA